MFVETLQTMKEYKDYEIYEYSIFLNYTQAGFDCTIEVPYEMLSSWIDETGKTTIGRDTYKGGIPDEEFFDISERKYIEEYFYKSEQEEFFNTLING